MNGHYAIAIDGPSGAGKSSLARAAAAQFGFIGGKLLPDLSEGSRRLGVPQWGIVSVASLDAHHN